MGVMSICPITTPVSHIRGINEFRPPDMGVRHTLLAMRIGLATTNYIPFANLVTILRPALRAVSHLR